MHQLTFQFDGDADQVLQPTTQDTAKQCHRVKISESSHAGNNPFPRWEQSVPMLGTSCKRLKACELSVGWALRQVNPSAALQKVMARVKLFSQAAAAVAFGFSLMFLASIIGG